MLIHNLALLSLGSCNFNSGDSVTVAPSTSPDLIAAYWHVGTDIVVFKAKLRRFPRQWFFMPDAVKKDVKLTVFARREPWRVVVDAGGPGLRYAFSDEGATFNRMGSPPKGFALASGFFVGSLVNQFFENFEGCSFVASSPAEYPALWDPKLIPSQAWRAVDCTSASPGLILAGIESPLFLLETNSPELPHPLLTHAQVMVGEDPILVEIGSFLELESLPSRAEGGVFRPYSFLPPPTPLSSRRAVETWRIRTGN